MTQVIQTTPKGEATLGQLDIQGLEEKIWRKSHSYNSVRSFHEAIRKFEIFLIEKAISLEEIQNDPYTVLDKYVSWLDKSCKPATIAIYVSFIRRLLNYNSIKVSQEDFKDKVTLPKKRIPLDEAVTPEQIRYIILSLKHQGLKTLLMLLKDTCARPSEILGLQLKHFNLAHDPPYITIPEYLVKNDMAREVFFTPETKTILVAYLKAKGIKNSEQFLFLKDADPYNEVEFQKALAKKLRIYEKAWLRFLKITKLMSRVERCKNPRYKIHIYSFKKFVFTKMVDTLGELAAHAVAGYKAYLITYYKKSREERAEDFRKLIPKLSVFGSEDPLVKQKDQATKAIQNLNSEQLRKVLEILRIGKTSPSSE